MFQSLDVFRMAHDMAVHAGQRQSVIAQNVANADTPGFRAKDIPSFQAALEGNSSNLQRATRNAHLHGTVDGNPPLESLRDRAQASLDGNSVSIESEMMKAVETKRQHDRALAIYRSALDVLRRTVSTS
ncbi:MAG: FlgB family protein [Paracoccaceae bacterium]